MVRRLLFLPNFFQFSSPKIANKGEEAYYLSEMDRIAKIQVLLQQNPKDNFLRHALALEYIKLNETGEARVLFESI
ncbi:MAG: hypothetical protein RL596_2376, partial [Bacteroidota bacterium]